MAASRANSILGSFGSIALRPSVSTDAELLEQIVDRRDETAFRSLVERHAAMVWGVCRRVLDHHDAEEAFQATFAVLWKKAGAIRPRSMVSNWLYGVARQTSLQSRRAKLRRTARERTVRTRPEATAPLRAEPSELIPLLEEELARLPDKYRAVLILCELEGKTRREAAVQLAWPEGTVAGRLARAKALLAERLARSGIAIPATLLATMLESDAVAAPRRLLITATIHCATTGAFSPPVATLTDGVLKAMLLSKLKFGIVALALLGAALAGFARVAGSPDTAPPPPVVRNAPLPKEPAWKAEFRKAYGLKDGEVIRRVPLPHPECRAEYFRDRIREAYKRSNLEAPEEAVNRDHTNFFTKFGWKDGWTVEGATEMSTPVKPEDGVPLERLLQMTTGFTRTRIEGNAEALALKVRGDFVVRVGADPAKIAAALEKILRDECELKVSLAAGEIEKEVYVLSGKYLAKPLAERKPNRIEIYAVNTGERTTGGGGGGDLHAMAKQVEGFCEARIIVGEVADAPKSVEWHFNFRGKATALEYAQDRDPAGVMANLEAQTGLTAKREKRKIKVLLVKMVGAPERSSTPVRSP